VRFFLKLLWVLIACNYKPNVKLYTSIWLAVDFVATIATIQPTVAASPVVDAGAIARTSPLVRRVASYFQPNSYKQPKCVNKCHANLKKRCAMQIEEQTSKIKIPRSRVFLSMKNETRIRLMDDSDLHVSATQRPK
jgi:hypothetical protein